MPYPPAYLLVFHGSRDPRPEAAANVLAKHFLERIQHVESKNLTKVGSFAPFGESLEPEPPLVRTACLECGPLPLHQQIEQFGASLQAAVMADAVTNTDAISNTVNLPKIVVVPLFLLPGVHVMEDIPQAIALAQQTMGDRITIEMRPPLGSHRGLHRLVTERMAAEPMEAWILLAHGSRRPGANQPIEDLAEHLGAVTAYWSVPPSLESRLQTLMQLGIRKIAILPYFLFAGSITDAIAQMVAAIALQFPSLSLHLTAPLEASSALTDLLVDLAQHKE